MILLRALLAAALFLFCASPLVAQAQPGEALPALGSGDYGLGNVEWNGLSRFVALAERQEITLEPGSTLDFSTLTPQDRLILLYPTEEIDPDEFARFVIDGGRVVLADDFGRSEKLLARLGIERRSAEGIKHEAHYLGRPGLPLFKPGGRHALLEGVEEVVANHPTALVTQGGAVLPFEDERAGLVYDMRLGRGKVIVISDASLLINHMIGVKDNAAFVRNVLDYLCVDVSPCKAKLLVGAIEASGDYEAVNSTQEDLGQMLEEGLGDVNAWLERLATGLPGRHALYYASLLLLVGTVAFVVTVFPWKRALKVAPQTGPPAHVKPLSEFEWNLLRYQRSGAQANYALPLAILRLEFERLFFGELLRGEAIPEVGDPQRGPFLRRATQAYVDRYLHEATGKARSRAYLQTLQLLLLLGKIPPRHRLFLDSEAYFNERELVRIYRQCKDIFDTLGVGQDYERRTRRR